MIEKLKCLTNKHISPSSSWKHAGRIGSLDSLSSSVPIDHHS